MTKKCSCHTAWSECSVNGQCVLLIQLPLFICCPVVNMKLEDVSHEPSKFGGG